MAHFYAAKIKAQTLLSCFEPGGRYLTKSTLSSHIPHQQHNVLPCRDKSTGQGYLLHSAATRAVLPAPSIKAVVLNTFCRPPFTGWCREPFLPSLPTGSNVHTWGNVTLQSESSPPTESPAARGAPAVCRPVRVPQTHSPPSFPNLQPPCAAAALQLCIFSGSSPGGSRPRQ